MGAYVSFDISYFFRFALDKKIKTKNNIKRQLLLNYIKECFRLTFQVL
jgi:hypothetical protein